MSSPFLPDYLANAEFALRRQIPLLTANQLVPRDGIHAMCTMFRQRGVCSLLLTGVPDGYYINMMQSASAYLYYLENAKEDDKVTSFAKPFFDCITGAYWEPAEQIASKSRTTWHPDFEYEDDFLYVIFLMRFFFLQGSKPELESILKRYEEVLEGAAGVRLDLCKSFLENDNNLFEECIQRLLEDRLEKVEQLIDRGSIGDEEASWLRNFSNEGTAIIKLAQRHGFTPEENYLNVPEPIRPASPFAFFPNAWRTLDYKASRSKKA